MSDPLKRRCLVCGNRFRPNWKRPMDTLRKEFGDDASLTPVYCDHCGQPFNFNYDDAEDMLFASHLEIVQTRLKYVGRWNQPAVLPEIFDSTWLWAKCGKLFAAIFGYLANYKKYRYPLLPKDSSGSNI